MTNRLEFDSVELSFSGRSLLKSVYMSCETGHITGLLGRNGSGKSTLMKIVFGSKPFEQKSVRINGESLGVDYLSTGVIAYLPQGPLIPIYLSIGKAFALFDIATDELTRIFPETADMLDLTPSRLSGGYRRIFEIFLILRSKAMFCLLDEPFTGLTPVYIERIKELLVAGKERKGIIITDHMHKHVTEIADRLYLLVNGQTYPVTAREQLVTLGYLSNL